MNQFPHDDHADDDHELVDFLRQHRPAVPPGDPSLEDRLFDAIAATSQPTALTPFRRSTPRPERSRAWVVPYAIAASLIATAVSYRVLVPTQPSKADLATLQAFAESNWQGTFSSNTTDDPTPLFSDATAN